MKNGWTLIELLFTLLVAGILLIEAIPAFGRFAEQNRLVVDTNRLVSALDAARLAAISKDKPIAFCASDAQAQCSDDWSTDRWAVFVDTDHDGQRENDERLLSTGRVQGADAGLSVAGNGPFRKAVLFMPTGVAERKSGAFAAGRLRVCADDTISPNATDIVLSATGRLRLEHHDFDGDCPPP